MPETTQLRLGSLFSGALVGGLDLAIEDVFGAELRWVSDIIARDKHGRQIGDAPRILAHRDYLELSLRTRLSQPSLTAEVGS